MVHERGTRFEHPLIERYASEAMVTLFSPRSRHGTWRELWQALARAEHELGLPIDAEQLEELRARADEFDWDRVAGGPVRLPSTVTDRDHISADPSRVLPSMIALTSV